MHVSNAESGENYFWLIRAHLLNHWQNVPSTQQWQAYRKLLYWLHGYKKT